MPLWIHAPFEMARGFTKWLCVSLERDNPLKDATRNATFLGAAKKAHRTAFWTGKPVTKGPKWRVMVWRWGLVFTVLAFVKYLPLGGWSWLARRVGDLLVVAGHVARWCWQHWGWLPLLLVGLVSGVWLVRFGAGRLVTWLAARESTTEWFEVVLYVRDKFVGWVKGRGNA